ncbi:MAG: DeoR/GlpR transcriptional regulator [Oligosphaeraceae bacterium]|nr:DeoR/GlpR transcriptional regulator [Oligosphaeraceae bacterium]
MGRAPSRRQTKIFNYLQDVPEVSVAELVKLTGASEATVRRDLLNMEKEGLLVRTFGGARCAVQQSLVLRTFEHRSMLQHDQKLAIAAAAADLIKPGMTIVIDSGTTCWHFSAQLKLKEIKPLRIITPALAVIETLGGNRRNRHPSGRGTVPDQQSGFLRCLIGFDFQQFSCRCSNSGL